MEIKDLEAIIEALLFASGENLTLEKIAEITEIDKKTAKLLMDNMILNFKNSKSFPSFPTR